MNLSHSENLQIIEAVLIIENEPIPASKLAAMCEINTADIPTLISKLNEKYSQGQHGFEIISVENRYMLIPGKPVWEKLKPHYKQQKNINLSGAALETVAIVAYRQPITISQISVFRGVQSASIVDQLCRRGFLKIVGKKEAPGNPMEYGTTDLFLSRFGLASLRDLPKLEAEYQKMFEMI